MKKSLIITFLAVAVVSLGLFTGVTVKYFSDINNPKKQVFTETNYIIEDLYHDQGYVYMDNVSPTENDAVTYKLRAKRGNVKKAWLCFTMDVEKTDMEDCVYQKAEMSFEKRDESGYYDYFTVTLPAQESSYSYHFECENDLEYVWYDAQQVIDITPPSLRSSDWSVLVNYSTPEWLHGAIWYSVMPDSFNNGDLISDKLYNESFSGASSGKWTTVIQHTWGNTHFSANDWFGGDLQGIIEKEYYLQGLGIDSLQINPIWYTYHNAGYGAYDLTMIDSCFGNSATLQTLIDDLHANGIKISLDAVLQYYVASGKILDAADIFPINITEEDGLNYVIVYNDEGDIVAGRWGNDIDFSSKTARDWLYAQPKSVIKLYLTDYGIDGWRLDVGAMLSGTDKENWGNAYQILNDIKKHVKELDENNAFISETITSSVGLEGLPSDILTRTGTIDSFWNYNYTDPVRLWASGETTVGALANSIYNGVVRLPRDMANSSYNSLSTHDRSRIYQVAQNYESLLASVLLNMTFVGAPVIYYGDEIGMTGDYYPWLTGGPPSGFGSFNWNESEWDYYVYNYYRSLIDLRKTYKNTFTSGTFIELEVNEGLNYYSFGRMNSDGKIAVVLNQNQETLRGITVDMKKLSVPNGETVCDWLSGRTYVVKSGKIVVDVLPGGAALVVGKNGNFVGKYELVKLGVDYSDIIQTDAKDFTVKGTTLINNTYDTAKFACVPLYNNASISATVSGKAVLMLRNSAVASSEYYAAVINGDTLEVWAREKELEKAKKLCTEKISLPVDLKIERTDGNKFVCMVNGTAITDATAVIPRFGYKILGGFMANNGEGELKNLNVCNEEECAYVDFNGGFGSVFGVNEKAVFENGKAKLNDTELVTAGSYKDFSVKAKLQFAPEREYDYAGVFVGKSLLDSYIVAGKIKLNSSDYYFVGTVTGGVPVIYFKTACVGEEFEVQLEKVGTFYYAAYKDSSTQGVYKRINNTSIVANYSDIVCGIIANGKTEATFDYYARGNATAENPRGEFYGTDYGEITLYDDRGDFGAYAKYKIAEGEWQYVENGWQFVGEGNSLIYLSDEYKDFRFNINLRFDEDKTGYIDFVFGSRRGKVSDSAYKFRLYNNGNYEIYEGTRICVSGTIEGFNKEGRFAFENIDGVFTVYHGEKPYVIASVYLDDYDTGYICFASDTKYSFLNPGVTNKPVTVNAYKGTIGIKHNRVIVNATTTNYALASVTQLSLGDFIVGTNVHLVPSGPYVEAECGFIIGSRVGAMPHDGGFYVCINSKNELCLYNGKTLIQAVTVNNLHYNSFYLITTVRNGVISVYADAYAKENQTYSDTPVIVYDAGYSFGGSLNFFCKNGLFDIANFSLYGLKPDEDFRLLDTFRRRKITEPIISEPKVSKDPVTEDKEYLFNTADGLSEWNRYNGMTNLITDDDGNYTGGIEIDGTGNWFAGVSNAAGQYEDYEITVTMKLDPSSGWAGLCVNKSAYSLTHERAGMLLFAQYIENGSKARITIYDNANRATASGISLDAGESSYGYFTFTVRCLDGVISVFNGRDTTGSPLGSFDVKTSPVRPNAVSGYISLVAGNTVAQFKSIKIHIL